MVRRAVVLALGLAAAASILLAAPALALFYNHSTLFDDLVRKANEKPRATHVLYDIRQETSSSPLLSAESEIERLLSDGFRIVSVVSPTQRQATCGPFTLPLGLNAVGFRHDGRFPDWFTYYIDMTVDDRCQVLYVQGHRAAPIAL